MVPAEQRAIAWEAQPVETAQVLVSAEVSITSGFAILLLNRFNT